MKRILYLFTTFAALTAVSGIRAEEGNLLRNGDFKLIRKADSLHTPAAWKSTGGAKTKIIRDGGRNAVQLRSGEQRIHLVQNGLKLVPGRDYVFGIEYRGTPGTRGLFYVERGGKVLALRKIECTGEWRRDEIALTMPPANGKLPYAVIAVEPGGGALEAAAAKIVELPPRSSENMLRNGDFSIATGADGRLRPAFWSTNQKGDFHMIKTDGGKPAVRFELDKENRGNLIQWGVPLEPGREYLFGIDHRGTPGAKGAFYVECAGHVLGLRNIECSEDWRHEELLVAMPPRTKKRPYAVVRTEPGSGHLDVADLKLVELPPRSKSNLLRNGSFKAVYRSGGRTMPSLWSTTNGADCETVKGPDGSNAVRFRPHPKERRHFVQWGVPLEPGKTYLFSLRYRGAPGTKFIYGVERGGKQHFSQLRMDVKCGSEWQTLRHMIVMPDAPAPNIPYAVIATQPGGEWIEIADLRIFPGEAALKNGDFEQGEKHWKLENAVIVDAKDHGKVVQLDGVGKKASVSQGELLIRKGRNYELSYDARGGDDPKYTDSQNATWYRLALVEADGHPYSTTANWQDSFRFWQHKSIYFTANRNSVVTLVGELRYPGTVTFDNIALREVDFIGAPLELVYDTPWNYARGAETGAKGTFSGSVFVGVKADRIRVSFNGESREMPADKEVKWSFPVPGAAGRYPIDAAALDGGGKAIVRIADVFTVRGPKPANYSHEVFFDDKHRMYLDGKPFFPIMTWRNRGPLPIEESYPRFVELGFNIIECPIANLDVADAAGLYALPEMPAKVFRVRTPKEAQEYLAEFKAKYARIAEHPAVIGYFSVDEPTWRGDAIEPYAAGYRFLRDEFDAWRPVYINEAPRGSVESLRPVADACDIYGVDIYPIPSPNPHSELDDKTVTSVGKYTDICRDVTRGRKPIWMCLQGFAWGTLTGTKEIYPTYDESRFMAFDAIAHGATGLVYWGLFMGPGENPEFLAGLKRVIGEVTAVSAYLVGETVEKSVVCADPAIRVMHKRAPQGDLWIVLNESKEEKTVRLIGELPKRPEEISRLAMPETHLGEIMLKLPACGVYVFRDADKPAAEPLYVPKERRPQNVYRGRDGFKRGSWVWYPGESRVAKSRAYFEHEFTLDKAPAEAELSVACDDMFRCWVNGELVMEHCGWSHAQTIDAAKYLKPGRNTIRIHAADAGGPPCGLLYGLVTDDGRAVLSGADTRVSKDGRNDWRQAEVLGKYGIKPWTLQVSAVPYAPPIEEIPLPKE